MGPPLTLLELISRVPLSARAGSATLLFSSLAAAADTWPLRIFWITCWLLGGLLEIARAYYLRRTNAPTPSEKDDSDTDDIRPPSTPDQRPGT